MSIIGLIEAIDRSGENLRPSTPLEKRLSTALYGIGAGQGLYFSGYFIYKLTIGGALLSVADLAGLYMLMSVSLLIFCIGSYRLIRFGLLSIGSQGGQNQVKNSAVHYHAAMETR